MPQQEQLRLDSWKTIAVYLGRDLRTVMRWEREKGFPVHRVPGGKRRAVFAYRHEIDAWLREGNVGLNDKEAPSAQDARKKGHAEDSLPPLPAHAETSLVSEQELASKSSNPLTPTPVIPKFRWLRIAGLAGLGLAVLSAVVFFAGGKKFSATDPPMPDAPIVPRGIEHWLRIGLVNGQPESVAGPFQQLLAVDSSRYARFEADNLQNVQFLDKRGSILPSWVESGNSNLSPRTVYWVRLTEGLTASTVSEIYMGFAPKTRNVFNTATTGEAPGLSPIYGQYDSGSSVFLRYANFAGESLPQGWYSGVSPGGRGSVQVRNGILISHSGRGGGTAFLGSDWAVRDNVAEVDLRSQVTINGQEMIFVCSASPTSYQWTPDSVGYQNMSGLELEDNNSGTPSVVATAKPNPTQSSVIGFQGSILFANYQPVARVDSRICGGNYLASAVNTGYEASFSFDWIRLRRPSPNAVMPTAIFGDVR